MRQFLLYLGLTAMGCVTIFPAVQNSYDGYVQRAKAFEQLVEDKKFLSTKKEDIVQLYVTIDKGYGSQTGTGTGYVIGKDLVLTAYHVGYMNFDGIKPDSIEVLISDGENKYKKVEGEVLYGDKEKDLAIVRVPGVDNPDFVLNTENNYGKEVTLIGHGGLFFWTVKRGTLDQPMYVTAKWGWKDWYNVSKDLGSIGGDSGGPVFLPNGDLVGVLIGGKAHLSIIVSAESVKDFLEKYNSFRKINDMVKTK